RARRGAVRPPRGALAPREGGRRGRDRARAGAARRCLRLRGARALRAGLGGGPALVPPPRRARRRCPVSDPVERAYDAWSKTYDTDENATRDLDAAVVRALPDELLSGEVLEVGCGTGKNTVHFAAKARRVVAFDFSEGMLAKARERVSSPNVAFVRNHIGARWTPGA